MPTYKNTTASLLCCLLITACATSVDERLAFEGSPSSAQLNRPLMVMSAPVTPDSETENLSDAQSNLYIGSFNIQDLGKTKSSKPDIMKRLAEIVRDHDIIAIQEISDVSNTTPGVFLTYINADGSEFDMVVSERSGKQVVSSNAQEQYAIYYDTAVLELVEDYGLFDDTENDAFIREPHAARFSTLSGDFDFTLVNIHTKPDAALEEIGALKDAVHWVEMQQPETVGIVVLGDFNASCDYANPSELDTLEFRGPDYNWIIPDSADTNLSSKICAYDRMVLTKAATSRFTGVWEVWEAFTSKKISDHWPIWAEFEY